MLKKTVVLLAVLMVVSACAAQAAEKKGKPAAKPVAVKVASSEPVAVQSYVSKTSDDEKLSEQLADQREEINKALADLKAQINKTSNDNSDAKVGGVVYFHWTRPILNAGSTVNNFGIDRAYLDFKKNLDAGASVRVTLDISQISGASKQNLFDYLKYAYFDLPLNVSAIQFIPFSMTTRIGLQQTVWIDWADKMLNLRYIAKSLLDNEGVMSSADFGVGAAGKFTLGSMPEIEYQGTLLNGAGYSASENNVQKDVGLRLNSTVFSSDNLGNVIVGVFGNVKNAYGYQLDGTSRQAGGMLGWKNDYATVYGEYVGGIGIGAGTSISGGSMGAKYEVLSGINLFVRADSYNPDMTKPNDQIDRSFYGVTYDWGKDVKLALDMQTVTGAAAASTSAGKTSSTLNLQTMVQI